MSHTRHEDLLRRFMRVRQRTCALCEPLLVEDMVVQSAPFVSPTRWHLAHTTWFFETFVITPAGAPYTTPDPRYAYLFNSYYNAVGAQFPQAQRGTLSRPSIDQIMRWRAEVDEVMCGLIERLAPDAALRATIELGLHHEQQHQELILMDIKHVLGHNPLRPAYDAALPTPTSAPAPIAPAGWFTVEPGVVEIGAAGADIFSFDNESPRHKTYLQAAQLADRLVTNAAVLAFIEEGGYQRPELWLSEGWSTVCVQGWSAPLYWERLDDQWHVYTLGGLRPVCPEEPACHLSFFEADALARFLGGRLPTEAEWETCCARYEPTPASGGLLDDGALHPTPRQRAEPQLLGHVWEWTQSAYSPYPGFQPAAGAIGEYNGKFMCNQMVLRGGCALTPRDHIRPTYRNFFQPASRWQMAGLRLARDEVPAHGT